MFKLRFLFLALLAGFSSLRAQTAKKDSLEHSLLWEISGKGLKKPSYLFGTIHIICPNDFFMPEYLKKKFSKTDQLVLEMDISDPSVLMAAQSGMLMQGKTLDSLLSKEDYKKVSDFFRDSVGGMYVMIFNRLKPLMAGSLVTEKMLNCDQKSYEQEYVAMAQKEKKTIAGLESAQDQLSVLDSIPLDQQAKMLVEAVTEFNKSRADFLNLLKYYKAQDLNGMLETSMKSDDALTSNENALLTNRNEKWVPQLEKMMPEKSLFIAVGAGHLAGEKGVISLLRKEGYTVKPVTK